jgi:hypothetical protein
MTENVPAQSGKRFVGDSQTKKVHDSTKKTCTVDQDVAIEFENLDIAATLGFVNCSICLGDVFINPINFVSIPRFEGTTVVTKEVPREIANKMISEPPEIK